MRDARRPAPSCAVMRPSPSRPLTGGAGALAGPGRDAGPGMVLAAECAWSQARARGGGSGPVTCPVPARRIA
jgi:hypothetical protein